MINETIPESITFDEAKFVFASIDYAVFGIMLAISAGIGIYFGFFDKSSNTTEEYLLGGRKMKILPIAISLVASQMSATSVMTVPTEIYQYGTDYTILILSILIVLPLLTHVVIPVFYNNNISNCYEYLEMRFDKKTRRLVTASFVLKVYLIIPLYLFVPSLAFSQVTGFNVHLINSVVCSVCIFYTMLGGIKAVVWTDVVQGGIIFFSIIIVVVLAVIKIGGFEEVFSRAIIGERIRPINFNLDLSTRTTFWNCLIGGAVGWIGHSGVHQSCVQRIVSLPSLRHARIALVIFAGGFLFIMGLNIFNGIVMYARYYLCDPITVGIVKKADKMLPFFVQDIIGSLTGVSGIFISCVFSAALSTMSANLNTLSGLVYFDYVKPFIHHTESRANYIMKILVVITGVYCVFAGLIVEQFSSILQLAFCIGGLTQGAVSGIFLLGMLCPKVHSKGAFIGTIASMLIMSVTIVFNTYMEKAGKYYWDTLPTKTEGCTQFNFTETVQTISLKHQGYSTDFLSNFRVSFYWYAFLGAFWVWVIGIPLSYFFKAKDEEKLNPKLIASVVHRFLDEQSPKEEIPLKQ